MVPEHNGHLDLVVLMLLLGKQQVNSIWVEAARRWQAHCSAGLVDELIVYVAPKLLGSDARGLFVLPGLENWPMHHNSNLARFVRWVRMFASI